MPRIAAILLLVAFALPAGAQPQALPAAQLRKIKGATVYVKVAYGPLRGSGSGFVVHAADGSGYIVTNEHVVSPTADELLSLLPGAMRKPAVEVVFHSGTAAEWTAKAEILYTHEKDDLAILRVRAAKAIPEPLSLTGADKLPETTPVFVCGFPFGDDLAAGAKNPEISIGVASVSSNRTDERGKVAAVQLNGALNPGNSGGPVVSQAGDLVGVAVRTVKGAGIGFAVPPDKVRRIVDEVHFAPPIASWVDGPPRKVRLESRILDARGRIKRLLVVVAPAPEVGASPDVVSKMTGAKSYTPTQSAGVASMEFPVPATSHYWVQYVWVDGNGTNHRTTALELASERETAEQDAARFERPGLLDPPTSPPPKNGCGVLGLVDDKDRELPAVAAFLAPTPQGQIDVEELNRIAPQSVGQKFTVDILTNGDSGGFGDGPSLHGYDRRKSMPQGLDFVVDRSLALRADRRALNGLFIAVRITGTIQNPSKAQNWKLFVVEELGYVGLDGAVLATFRRTEPWESRRTQPSPGAPSPRSGGSPKSREPLPPDAYPLGSAELQKNSYQQFVAQDPAVFGRRHRFAVVFFGKSAGVLRQDGRPIDSTKLHVKSPETGTPMSSISFFASREQYDKVWTALKNQPNREVTCVFEFQPVQFLRSAYNAPTTECVVHAIEFRERPDAVERVTVAADWSNAGVALPKDAVTHDPTKPRADARPPNTPAPAMPPTPRAVPAPGAAPAEPPEVATSLGVRVASFLAVIAILGAFVWACLRFTGASTAARGERPRPADRRDRRRRG